MLIRNTSHSTVEWSKFYIIFRNVMCHKKEFLFKNENAKRILFNRWFKTNWKFRSNKKNTKMLEYLKIKRNSRNSKNHFVSFLCLHPCNKSLKAIQISLFLVLDLKKSSNKSFSRFPQSLDPKFEVASTAPLPPFNRKSEIPNTILSNSSHVSTVKRSPICRPTLVNTSMTELQSSTCKSTL